MDLRMIFADAMLGGMIVLLATQGAMLLAQVAILGHAVIVPTIAAAAHVPVLPGHVVAIAADVLPVTARIVVALAVVGAVMVT
jgi:hypothetical protein